MRRKISLVGTLAAVVAVVVVVQVWAYPESARQTKTGCATCHANPAGGEKLTVAGTEYKADHAKVLAAAAAAAEYVGGNKCKMCHIKEYKSWQESAHANAFGNLAKADAKAIAAVATALKVELKGAASKSDACVVCHVTGFHLPGGYPQADSAKTAAVASVSCEACHGPGSLHVKAAKEDKKKMIARAVSSSMCIQCHTTATSPKFESVDYMKRGVHAVPAAE